MLPTGAITFLFTDVQDSTRTWEQYPQIMKSAMARHDELLEVAIANYDGQIVKKRGDGYHAVFNTPINALRATIEAQRSLQSEPWDEEIGSIYVRMSLHTAATEERQGDYYGSQVNRAARLEAVAHGGQILISMATHELVLDDLPEDVALIDLGEHRLKGLSRPERIFQVNAAGLGSDFPPLRSLDAPKSNLPSPSTSFIGREQELVEINELFRQPTCRLLTLIGPGGIGKTRLALQAALNLVEEYPNGVYFVPLSAVPATEQIVSSVAGVMKFNFDSVYSDGDPKDQLINYLAGRSTLLVLDNYEHLIDSAYLLAEILEGTQDIEIMVTSRERLNLQGEWTYEVAGLSYPHNGKVKGIEKYCAVQLFQERARHVIPNFVLTPENSVFVKRICQLVEGMPLGIELAAAWLSVLSTEEIVNEIERNLDFLAANRRDVPAKHRSIRAVFDQSWKMLSDDEQAVFPGLSIFKGGFTRQAVSEVAGVNLFHLSAFMDKSLVRKDDHDRYVMHELLRQYASEKLDAHPVDFDRVRQRHCRYYVSFLASRARYFPSRLVKKVRDEIRIDLENIRAAYDWMLEHWKSEEMLPALHNLFDFFQVDNWHEGVEAFRKASYILKEQRGLRIDGGSTESRPLLFCMVSQAFFQASLGEVKPAESIARQCLPLLRDLDAKLELAICLQALGVNADTLGNHEDELRLLDESILISGELKLVLIYGYGLLWKGHAYLGLGDLAKAEENLENSQRYFEEVDFPVGAGFAVSKLGLLADAMGEYQQAIRYHEQALHEFEEFDELAGAAYTISRLSLASYGLGAYEDAVIYGQQAYDAFAELNHRWGMAASLCRKGFGLLGMHDDQGSWDTFYQAMDAAMHTKANTLVLLAMVGIANLLCRKGEQEEAYGLFAFVVNHPAAAHHVLTRAKSGLVDLETRLPADVTEAAQERVKNWEIESVAAGLRKKSLSIDPG